MLAERIESWADGWMQEGVLKGKLEGKLEGEALALQRLLTKRFGAMPAAIAAQITAASQDQIETWFDLAIDAPTMDAVFGPTQH
jgi:hypothetical protein